MSPKIQKPISRRDFLKLGAAGGGALAASNLVMWLSGCTSGGGGEPTSLNVLTPAAPDPAPPGVAEFSMDAFAKWQEDNNAKVVYESPRGPNCTIKWRPISLPDSMYMTACTTAAGCRNSLSSWSPL